MSYKIPEENMKVPKAPHHAELLKVEQGSESEEAFRERMTNLLHASIKKGSVESNSSKEMPKAKIIPKDDTFSEARNNIKKFLDDFKQSQDTDYDTLMELKNDIDDYEKEIQLVGGFRSFSHEVSKIVSKIFSPLFYVSKTQEALDIYERFMPNKTNERKRILSVATQRPLKQPAKNQPQTKEKDFSSDEKRYLTDMNYDQKKDPGKVKKFDVSDLENVPISSYDLSPKEENKTNKENNIVPVEEKEINEEVKITTAEDRMNNMINEYDLAFDEVLKLDKIINNLYDKEKAINQRHVNLMEFINVKMDEVSGELYQEYKKYYVENIYMKHANIEKLSNQMIDKIDELFNLSSTIKDELIEDSEYAKIIQSNLITLNTINEEIPHVIKINDKEELTKELNRQIKEEKMKDKSDLAVYNLQNVYAFYKKQAELELKMEELDKKSKTIRF